jgi:hypothetical protein
MSEKIITPIAMADLLQSLYPAQVHGSRDRQDLEALRDSYRARDDDPLVRYIQSSLNHAIDEWDDEQVEDFWVNFLLEPPQSDAFQVVSAQERRARLRQLYGYLLTLVEVSF